MRIDNARTSRAFQFIPGHVGGRVDSAQPVRRKTGAAIGSAAILPGEGPTGFKAYLNDAAGLGGPDPMEVYTGAPPENTSSAVGVFSTNGFDTITLPNGWTERISGTVGGSLKYVAAVAPAWSEACGTTVTFSGFVGPAYHTGSTAVAFFQGGSGGSWNVEKGVEYPASSLAGFTNIGSVENPWFQFGTATAVYTLGSVPSGVQCGQGFCTGYIHPYGTLSGEGFLAAMGTPKTSDVIWDYNSIGAYGAPSSVCFGATWVPN